jgi:hypothetical protein
MRNIAQLWYPARLQSFARFANEQKDFRLSGAANQLFFFLQLFLKRAVPRFRTFGREQRTLPKFRKAQRRSTKNTTKHKEHEVFFQSHKGIFASEGSEAKISARIYLQLQLKHTINICENLRNLPETEFRIKHSTVMAFLSTIDYRPSTCFLREIVFCMKDPFA